MAKDDKSGNNYTPEYQAYLDRNFDADSQRRIEDWDNGVSHVWSEHWAECWADLREVCKDPNFPNFAIHLVALIMCIISLVVVLNDEKQIAYWTGPDGMIPKIEVKLAEVSGKLGAKVDELLEPDPNWPPAKSGQEATKPVAVRQASPVAPMPGFVLVDNPNHVPGQEMFTGEPEHLCVAFTAENGKAVARGVVDMENCLRQGQ